MDWEKLRIFRIVAEVGSFTAAADQLNTTQSTVSRQIRTLEEDLDVSLFHRHARGLVMTEQGEMLFQTAVDVFARIDLTESRLREARDQPSGNLVITTTIGFGSTWLIRHLRRFTDIYPDINVHLIVTDHELDLSMRQADAAIRFYPPDQADLIQRKLVKVHYHIYASPDYLERMGTPESAQDLDNHHLVIYGPTVPRHLQALNWLTQIGRPNRPRRPFLQINNLYGVLQAVESGVGLGALPDYLVRDNDKIKRILSAIEVPVFQSYFVYPEELRSSARIAAFRDYLVEVVRQERDSF